MSVQLLQGVIGSGETKVLSLGKINRVHPQLQRARATYSAASHFTDSAGSLIDATNTKYACKFLAPATGDIEMVLFSIGSVPTSGTPSLVVSVEGVDGANGFPNGVTNGAAATTITSLPTGLRVFADFAGTKPSVTFGTVYNMVFDEQNAATNSYYLRQAGTWNGNVSSGNFPTSSYYTGGAWATGGTGGTPQLVYMYVKISGVWYNMDFPLLPLVTSAVTHNGTSEYGISVTPVHDSAIAGIRLFCGFAPTGSNWTFSVYSADTAAAVIDRVTLDTDFRTTATSGTIDVMFSKVINMLANTQYFIGWYEPSVNGSFRKHDMATANQTTYGDIRRASFGHDVYYCTRTYAASPSFNSWSAFDPAVPDVPVVALRIAGELD